MHCQRGRYGRRPGTEKGITERERKMKENKGMSIKSKKILAGKIKAVSEKIRCATGQEASVFEIANELKISLWVF